MRDIGILIYIHRYMHICIFIIHACKISVFKWLRDFTLEEHERVKVFYELL